MHPYQRRHGRYGDAAMTLPHNGDEQDDPIVSAPLIATREILAGMAVFFGAIVFIGAILVFRSDTGSDIPGSVAATGSETPTPAAATDGGTTATQGASQAFVIPANADEQAIENLSRLSVILLPAGDWDQLYDDFTADFQARCSAEEFAQSGVDAADELGDTLQLLGFRGLQSINLTGDTASAVIVGEIRGQSEYSIEASFAKEGGAWKLAPIAGTEGCGAFNRLSG